MRLGLVQDILIHMVQLLDLVHTGGYTLLLGIGIREQEWHILIAGIDGAQLLSRSSERSLSYRLRPIIEIPLPSFTLQPASAASQFDYEISPIS